MLKRLAAVMAAALVLSVAGPALASQCPKLIKEGRELLANVSGETKNKAQQLLDEAQKLHQDGQHADSVAKAKEALELLGKKM